MLQMLFQSAIEQTALPLQQLNASHMHQVSASHKPKDTTVDGVLENQLNKIHDLFKGKRKLHERLEEAWCGSRSHSSHTLYIAWINCGRCISLNELRCFLLIGSYDAFLALSSALHQLPRCCCHCSNSAAPASQLVKGSYQRAKWLSSRVQSSSDDIAEGTLEQIGGGFTMQLLIGNPPQPVDVLFDTGSDLVWVRCSRDQSSSDFFDETISSTYQGLSCSDPRCRYLSSTECISSCEYFYEYGGGSETRGRFSTETVSLHMANGTMRKFAGVLIGCGDENDGFDGLQGIGGFGRGRISLISQLRHSIDGRFSYCLSSATNSSPLFYGSAAVIHESNVQSTPLLNSPAGYSYYFVNVIGLSVGGGRLVIPHSAFDSGTILDSGTTLTFLPDYVYNRLMHAFIIRISLPRADGSHLGFDLCYDVSSAPDYTFPSLVLEFENARMVPAQENYFIAPSNDSMVCLAVAASDALGINIIGNVMQQGFHILYDTAASTLSFASAECDKL